MIHPHRGSTLIEIGKEDTDLANDLQKFNLNFQIYNSISFEEILLLQDIWMEKISVNVM
jgi:hypothetical protein